MLYCIYAILDTIRTVFIAVCAIGLIWLAGKTFIDLIRDGLWPCMILGLLFGVLCEVISHGWKKLKAKALEEKRASRQS